MRDSLFSRGFYLHILIAKESNTFLLACADRLQGCGARRSSCSLWIWPRFTNSSFSMASKKHVDRP